MRDGKRNGKRLKWQRCLCISNVSRAGGFRNRIANHVNLVKVWILQSGFRIIFFNLSAHAYCGVK